MSIDKKGSSSVFLMLIMATLFAIVFGLITGARNEYIKSRTDGVMDLSGDSVMSEFDYYVQKEYGLFLLGGRSSYLSGRLRSYVDYGLGGMDKVRITSAAVTGEGYGALQTDIIRNQILEQMKYEAAEGFAKKLKESDAPKNEMEYETLRHGGTIASLSSADMPSPSLTSMANSLGEKLGDVSGILSGGTDAYLMNKYIEDHFNNSMSMVSNNHFFRNEMEYILGGKMSDRENEKRTDRAIEAIRFPLNLKYLYSDKEKMEALLTAAELITPEAAPATQLLMAATWAYAESDNDVKLLHEGHKVPVNKDKSTWAIDLDSAVEGVKSGVFRPDKEKGHDYTDYLKFLLFFQDDTVKTARIMDLIQINTRMSYDKNFIIQENCAGIHMSVKVNGRTYRYEKKY